MDVAWVDQLSVTFSKVVVLATYEMCTQALQMNDEIVDMCMLLDYENRHDLWVDLGSSWCLAISLCLKTSAVWSQYCVPSFPQSWSCHLETPQRMFSVPK